MTQWLAYSDGTALEGRPLAEITAEIWSWLEPAGRRRDGGVPRDQLPVDGGLVKR